RRGQVFALNGAPSRSRGGIFSARAAQAATVARFSSSVMVRHAPISRRVRKQPIHWLLSRSMVQTTTHGDVPGAAKKVMAPDYGRRRGMARPTVCRGSGGGYGGS